MPKLLIFDAFTLLIPEKTVANYALLRCKTFSLKIWVCKFLTNSMSAFFLRPNFPKPKPRLFSEAKLFKTDNETLQKLAKVSRLKPKPRLLNILDLKIWRLVRVRMMRGQTVTAS